MGLDDELGARRGALLNAAIGEASGDDVLTRAVGAAATSLVVREPSQGLVVDHPGLDVLSAWRTSNSAGVLPAANLPCLGSRLIWA